MKPIPQTRVTVYIPKDDYRNLRSILIQKGLSVSEFFRQKTKELLEKYST